MEHNPPGVFSASKKDGTIYYRASITHKKKHISLGSYPTALLAYGAYLEGTAILDGESLTITDYSCHRILPFAKWICLINYRDNRIYFANPIYVPGSTSNQQPHSSTIMPIFLSGSYWSMIAPCRSTSSSI